MIQSGTILDGIYQIIREIGQGGTGVIYLAEHLRLNKKVVVKKVKDHFAGQINGRAEVDILKHLHHTYLPQVYDFLVIGSSIYTVMEYIEGQDLQYYLDQRYFFPEETVRKWLMQLSEVLDYLHSRQPPILHSDIKPGNIMITRNGDVCLIDFNISLDGETTKDVQGISPWYAAPEQYERAQHILYGQEDGIILDGRMDIYSLGAVFYRVMTGYLPTPNEDQSERLLYMDIPYSDGLKAIVSKMIKYAPSRRYSSAGKLRAALEDISKMDPVYRRYGYLQMGTAFGWVLCMIAAVLCIYYGNWKNSVEQWQKAYQELYLSARQEDEVAIVAEGTELLNDVTYRAYLKRNADQKAEVLNIVGESYFRQEQYRNAADYYEEAWELDAKKGNYYENYIIALIRDGQTDKAGRLVGSTDGRRVLSEKKRNLIMLEIAWMSGETDEAQEDLEKIAEELADSGDSEVAADAYLLLADIYTEDGAYEEAVKMLQDALELYGGKDVRRQLGETAYLAAMRSDRNVYRNSYLSIALENYQILGQSANASYEDGLNLALIQRALEKYEDSNKTLKEMKIAYPDTYILPMWMCYNYLDLVKENGATEKIVSDLKFRYQDCCHIYAASGEKDEDMEQLKEIMNNLEQW